MNYKRYMTNRSESAYWTYLAESVTAFFGYPSCAKEHGIEMVELHLPHEGIKSL